MTSAVLAAFTAGCSNKPAAQARNEDDTARPRAVETDRVSRQEIRRAVDVTGTLAAADQVTISSQSEGVVSRIAVDLGDRIRAGQVMLELDRETGRVRGRVEVTGGHGVAALENGALMVGPGPERRAQVFRPVR